MYEINIDKINRTSVAAQKTFVNNAVKIMF